ncbi:MAG: DUF6527 family protein [Candidatus Omnitrophica bacterium]|nr:DUF6527 family protein [Candidatus Omnitrophota bacterium]
MKPISSYPKQEHQPGFVVWELDHQDGQRRLEFFCEACGYNHFFDERWMWNGDYVKPTFYPSLLVNGHTPSMKCHSFVTNGEIHYLADCFHGFKNQRIPLKP